MKVFPLYFSEFLWLIINRNEHVGKSASLFNKVFDFLGWFASEEKEMER